MNARSRDVRVNITSSHDERGFKSAEASAKVLERELNKLEQQQRRQVQMQTQAAREMAAAEAAKAAAIVEANRRQSDAMQASGRVLLGAATATAIGLGLSAKAAVDWQSAWAGVTKTIDGSPEQLSAVEFQLRNLARTLPSTHQEIAAVAEAAGQLGVRREDVASFTKTMIDLGETTNLSADEAATSLAQLSNIMGLSAKSSSQLGSALVALGNDGASTERDIVEMGLRIAGAGRTVGLTAPQVLGLASALSSVGIEAEAGGTAISRVMLQIDNDVASGADTLNDYARVAGMTADQFARKWKSAPAEALDAFIRGLGRMQSEGQNTTQTLADMGFQEVRVSDALRRASLAGDLLTESLRTGSEAFDENLALVEEANKRYATTESRLQMARNEINDAAIDIGGNLLPALAGAADGVASLAAGFGTLSPEVQGAITKFGAAAAGVVGITGAAAVGIPKLAELASTITDLRGGSSLLGRALGGAASVLAGPWGLALAGATLAAGAWLKAQGDARRRVDEVTASLDQQTGAITENTRATVYKQLADQGVIDKAKKLGIDLKLVLDAAIDPTTKGVERLTEAVAQQGWSYSEAEAAASDWGDILRGVGYRSDDVATSQQNLRDQVAAGVIETDDAAQSAQEFSGALDDAESAAKDAADAVDALAASLDELNGPALDAREAERRFQEAIDGVTASIEENGTALDLNTEQGRANEGALDALAQAGARRAQALLEQTGSEEQFRASLEQSRQSLYDAARQFGLSEEAAWAYVDQVLKVPPVVNTTVNADTRPALTAVQNLFRQYDNKSMTVYIDAVSRGGSGASPMLKQANGAVVDYYAAGGLREQHVAQIAPAGSWRVWGEPETGGEAYIPLAPAKRARSEDILGDVAGRFGGVYVRGAGGAALIGSGAAAGATGGGDLNVHIGQVNTRDSAAAIAAAVRQEARDALAAHGLADSSGGFL